MELTVNPSAIVFRDRTSFSAWVPNAVSYIQIPTDLFSILAFGKIDSQLLAQNKGFTKLVEFGFLIPNEGVIFNDFSKNSDSNDGLSSLINIEDTIKSNDVITVSQCFILRPSSKGFVYWSKKHLRFVDLTPDHLPVISTFLVSSLFETAKGLLSQFNRVDEVVKELLEHGVLHYLTEDGTIPKERKLVQMSLRDLVRKRKPLFKNKLTSVSADTVELDELKSTGKIPIYPVYCLKLDFHSTHLPLALGMILAFIKHYKNGILNDHYFIVPALLTDLKSVEDALSIYGSGVFLFSDYMWNISSNLSVNRKVKHISPESIAIHGGPSAPKYPDACRRFFEKHPDIDIVVRGEGEITVAEVLEVLADSFGKVKRDLQCLEKVSGLTFRSSSGGIETICRTPDRLRAVNLDDFPSPYLTGHFDRSEFRTSIVMAAILETNRGCPYGCTYCDWGSATLQKVRQFSMERVKAEIEWLASNEIPILWCADANFGIFDRDVDIAKYLVEQKKKFGFPKQFVANYAKNATGNVAEIVKTLRDGDISIEGIIAIQTTDSVVLDNVNRSNIKTKRYDELLCEFKKLHLPISTDLMMGLPGATVESFKEDLRYFFSKEVLAKSYATQVLPNSPMADPQYIEKFKIETDEKDNIISTYSYTVEDRKEMDRIYLGYHLFEGYGLLRYWLRFLQCDFDLDPLDFLQKLDRYIRSRPNQYPLVTWIIQGFKSRGHSPGGWRSFMEEIVDYTINEYAICRDSAFDTVIDVQCAVLPDNPRKLPEKIKLKHDFISYYFEQYRERSLEKKLLLRDYGPGEINIRDPHHLCALNLFGLHQQYDYHTIVWELESELQSSERAAYFIELDSAPFERPSPEIRPWSGVSFAR